MTKLFPNTRTWIDKSEEKKFTSHSNSNDEFLIEMWLIYINNKHYKKKYFCSLSIEYNEKKK